jgi:hypothetical protein
MAHKSYLLAICVALPACASKGTPAGAPALLSAQSPEARSEVAHVVAASLHREQVAIADDAFVTTSSIMIEPTHLEGRETRPPERFILLKRAMKCVLKRERTGEEWELKSARCTSASTSSARTE